MHSEKLKYKELCSFLLRKRSLFCAGRSIERTAGCPAVRHCSGSVPPVCLEVGCVCACFSLSATVTNVLPSADLQHGKNKLN